MAIPSNPYLDRLRQLGYPEHLIGGIAMNANSESSWNPTAVGDNGNAFGLLQWAGPRKAALFEFARAQGKDPGDPVVQADFTDYENQTSEKAAFEAARAAPDAGTAGAIWVNQWERPAAEHAARRTAEYTGGKLTGFEGADTLTGGTGGGGGGITALDPLTGQPLGIEQGWEIPAPSGRERLGIGLAALGEGLTSLGAGHGASFAATDRFARNLREQRGVNAKLKHEQGLAGSAATSVNSTVEQLKAAGRTDLAQSVADYAASGGAAGISPEDALKEHYKTGGVPGQALNEDQQAYVTSMTSAVAPYVKTGTEASGAATKIYEMAKMGNSASDQTMLTLFTKVLDPNSVSMPAEVKAVADGLGGWQQILANLEGYWDPAEGKLTDAGRRYLVEMTKVLTAATMQGVQKQIDPYQQRLLAMGITDTGTWLPTFAAPEVPTDYPGAPEPAPASVAGATW